MGGFIAKEAPVEKDGKPKVHLVTKRRLSGKPAVGSFSSGNYTMQKMRTRSDFCLLYYGATFFENSDIGCSCCVSELTCGEYNPTSENDLSLAPLYNETMTRNDVSAMLLLTHELCNL